MNVTFFYMAMIIGLFLSLLVEEKFGISTGGMIVPGYLALVCDDISQMILIFAVSFVVYFIINYILPKFVVLFGKRKFVATLIVGVIIKLILEVAFPLLPFEVMEFRGIGVVTPSLLANSYAKQGMRYTIPATLIVTYLTAGLVTVLLMGF